MLKNSLVLSYFNKYFNWSNNVVPTKIGDWMEIKIRVRSISKAGVQCPVSSSDSLYHNYQILNLMSHGWDEI